MHCPCNATVLHCGTGAAANVCGPPSVSGLKNRGPNVPVASREGGGALGDSCRQHRQALHLGGQLHLVPCHLYRAPNQKELRRT